MLAGRGRVTRQQVERDAPNDEQRRHAAKNVLPPNRYSQDWSQENCSRLPDIAEPINSQRATLFSRGKPAGDKSHTNRERTSGHAKEKSNVQQQLVTRDHRHQIRGHGYNDQQKRENCPSTKAIRQHSRHDTQQRAKEHRHRYEEGGLRGS